MLAFFVRVALWLGILCLIYIAIWSIYTIYFRLLRRRASFAEFTGEWALVTGSSYGMGKDIAVQLARKGMNLILLARSRGKLELLAAEIRLDHTNVQVEIVAADLRGDDEEYRRIEREIGADKRIVSVVVNNAGGAVEDPFKPYWEFSLEEERDISLLNVTGVVRITRMMLPHLVKRRKGRLINVGSLACMTPQLILPYSSDKAKILAFSIGLAKECEEFGVTVQCSLSGAVATPAYKEKPGFDTPTPDRFARAVLDYADVPGQVVPYWIHAIEAWFLRVLPGPLRDKVVDSEYKKRRGAFATFRAKTHVQ